MAAVVARTLGGSTPVRRRAAVPVEARPVTDGAWRAAIDAAEEEACAREAPPAPAHMLTAVKHGAVMVEIDLRNPNASRAQGEYAQFK